MAHRGELRQAEVAARWRSSRRDGWRGEHGEVRGCSPGLLRATGSIEGAPTTTILPYSSFARLRLGEVPGRRPGSIEELTRMTMVPDTASSPSHYSAARLGISDVSKKVVNPNGSNFIATGGDK